MINEKQSDVEILSTGNNQESIGMSLDLDSAQMLMQMLSKNLYSDGIGSTIRECASNALDSHRRAGIDKPIIVSFGINNASNYEFSVEDFGVGLDDDDVTNIISKYGKSTKRSSNTELGMFGLGFKSPLAYCSSFYFICRKNGVERKYMMYEGEELNTIDLLYTKNTTESNGVKVIVPVKYGDRDSFQSKMKEQLAYFENVYFVCDGIDNTFNINRSEHFQYSDLSSDENLHLCLDNVYYSIDFQKLGIASIGVPVALRFSLTDGLFPTPNREAIRITKDVKEKILSKIKHVANHYVNKYNESVQSITTFKEFLQHFSDTDKLVQEGNRTINVTPLARYSDVSFVVPKVKGITLLDLRKIYVNKDRFGDVYKSKFEIRNGRIKETDGYFYFNKTKDFNDVYIYSETISKQKKAYLKTLINNNNWITQRIIKKVRNNKLFNLEYSYYNILGLSLHPKHEWRQRIQEHQILEKMFFEQFTNLDELQIPKQWLDVNTPVKVKKDRKERIEGNVIGRIGRALENNIQGQHCKFVSESLDLSENINTLMVYSTEDDKGYLDQLYSASRDIYVAIFSPTVFTKVQNLELSNWMTYKEFMEGDTIEFKRIVTSYLIKMFIDKYSQVFNKREMLKDVCTPLYNNLNKLSEYKRKHWVSYASDDMCEAIKQVADVYNLYDDEIHPLYLQMDELMSKLLFIKPLFTSIYSSSCNTILVQDLFDYYSQSVDFEYYNVQLDKKTITETINELV